MSLALRPEPWVLDSDGVWNHKDQEWEMQFWPRCMWLDCGTTSGVTAMWFRPSVLFNPQREITQSLLAWWSSFVAGPENPQAGEIVRMIRGLGGPQGLVVGAEKFVVKRVAMEETFLSSPRIAARVDYALWDGIVDHDGATRRRKLLFQMPEEIPYGEKGNDRLRMNGLYQPGADHRNDSTQHCLAHLKKVKRAGLGVFKELYGWDEEWETS